MKYKMPTASRERLEELLTYLGDRAEDFKKCFDIESEWCWKYADLVLRGMKKRKLGYSEGHHVVPACFYGKRRCIAVDNGNLTVLTYAEHTWAHYCMVWCATGKMQGKLAMAFLIMYSMGICNKRPLMPSEAELLDAIPEMEIKRIQAMEPKWAKVEVDGRTHYSEDPKQHYKDYREANKEKIAARMKTYCEANKEKLAEQKKAYREANKEKLAEQKKAYREANKEKIAARMKTYYEASKEKILEQKKAYQEANKEKILEKRKAYYEDNKGKILEKRKAYYEDNKERIAERKKAWWAANKEKIAEQRKARYEENKEKILERNKAWCDANKERILEKKKALYEVKKAAGYSRRKNPLTGKQEWVFVGLPATPETPKSSTTAA